MAADAAAPVAELEIEAPERIAVGRGTAFPIAGYAYSPTAATRGVEIRAGDSVQEVRRFGLPRDDAYGRLPEDDPARPHAYRSGFVSLVDLNPVATPARHELELTMRLADGQVARAPLGTIEVLPEVERPDVDHPAFSGDGPRVAVCMATYEPPDELLERQLASLREQTHRNWICVISDDGSGDEAFARIVELTNGDPRFVVSRSSERLGFYRNFERALAMAPPEADFVALCDQDDRWRPDKLARLLNSIGGAQLVYSDSRIITPAGELVRPSFWTERRNNYRNFASLLLANSVTGAASLFRRDLLDDALPLPPRLAKAFHDHWLAVVALARGEIAYVDEPLWDYVQHDATVIGHLEANKRPRPIRRHLIERLRNPTGGSRAVYYFDWQQLQLFAEVLRLRCWERMTRQKRRTLRLLLTADSGAAGIGWLLARRARRLWGHDETLDRELFYSYALLRRRAVSLWTAGRRRPGRFLPRDESVPADSDRAA